MLLEKIPHRPGEQKRRMKMMHRSMWRQAQQTHVLIIRYFFKSKSISYHQGRNKSISYHAFSLSFPLSLFLPAKTRIKKAICRNLHSNSGQGTDYREPLAGCLPGFALEYSSSVADVLPKKMPYFPGEQIRQVKMIP
ncbi:hypothetical protein ACFX16_000109 [Malus domestica]